MNVELGFDSPVRVCDKCFTNIHEYKTMKEIIVFRHQRVSSNFYHATVLDAI